jgi:hypothetical protein
MNWKISPDDILSTTQAARGIQIVTHFTSKLIVVDQTLFCILLIKRETIAKFM